VLIRDAECTSFEAKIYMEGIPYCQRLPTRSAVRRTNLFDDHYEEILAPAGSLVWRRGALTSSSRCPARITNCASRHGFQAGFLGGPCLEKSHVNDSWQNPPA